MTFPRSMLVSLDDTAWYHCVSRCVRRAFLCGEDRLTGKNFDHRRAWIAQRIKELAGVFAIDVAAYAVMSNHYHLVAHIDEARARGWDTEETLTRWTQIFTGPLLVARYLSPARTEMDPAEIAQVEEMAATYRSRLHDLSWFMRILNESLARQANAEDGCTGRFWEGRFKSQALLDEQALLAAMAYVDLNPVRAGIAGSLETSDYTSIQERLSVLPAAVEEVVVLAVEENPAEIGPDVPMATEKTPEAVASPVGEAELATPAAKANVTPLLALAETAISLPQASLMPFDATGRTPWAVPFAFADYVELVDWTGRALHPKKKGFLPADQPRILDRMGMDGEAFIAYSSRFLKEFGSAVGAPNALVTWCARRQTKYLRGIRAARKVFGGEREKIAA